MQIGTQDYPFIHDVAYPLPIDIDRIYPDDINVAACSFSAGWTSMSGGAPDILSLFDGNRLTGIKNETTNNPKWFIVEFKKVLISNTAGFYAYGGGTFSNGKLEIITGNDIFTTLVDDSAVSTKYTSRTLQMPVTAGYSGIRVSCYTADAVTVSGTILLKMIGTVSRIQATNPSGVVTNIGATEGSSLKVALHDDLGFVGLNTPQNEIRTMEPVRLVGAGFEGSTIDTNFWLSGATGTGATVAQANAEAVLTSGTANAATCYLYSARRARYVSGTSLRYRSAKQVSLGVANNKRRWGVGYGATMPTITDGAYFQIDGTEFSVATMKGGVETKVTSFNGFYGASYTPTANVAAYEIYWTNSKVWFVVNSVLLHTVTASTTTWAGTMSFHVFATSLNSGDITPSQTLKTRSSTIFRMGKYETQPIYYHLSGNAATHVLKLGAGVLHKIVYNNTSGTNITIVDNITGTTPVVGVITTASGALGVWNYGIAFNTGLILITTGNGLDATIVYE